MKLELTSELHVLQTVGPDEHEVEGVVYVNYEGPISWSAPGPTYVHKWNGTAPAWEDLATLDELKARKSAEITRAKVEANQSYFVFAGKQIAVDEASFREMQSTNGYITLNQEMPGGWPGGWKAIDNTYVAIVDMNAWVTFYNTMVNTGLTNFNKSQTLKATITSATTAEEVAAIVW